MSTSAWTYPDPDRDEEAVRIAGTWGTSLALARILANRGIVQDEIVRLYLNPRLDSLHDPFLLPDMGPAVDRLFLAIDRRETVLAYGDYDVDGITGTAFLYLSLARLGARALHFVPERGTDGYGLSRNGIDKARAAGASVIVTVDCGVSAVEEIDYAARLGIDVIVCDHHVPPPVLPRAFAMINPKRKDSTYPFDLLCGVGVAAKLIQGMALARPGALDPGYYVDCLQLVALGTIADVVPLTGENRVFVRHGLRKLGDSTWPGIQALKRTAGLVGRRIESGDVAFSLAPRINASGRMGRAKLGLSLLLERDPTTASRMADEIEEDNDMRRRIDEAIHAEAVEAVEALPELPDALVLWSDRWHSGVLGIVASRLVERYRRPSVLIALEGEEGRGSGRSVAGFHLQDALSRCGDLLIGFGGHALACGFTVERDALEPLRERLVTIAGDERERFGTPPPLRVDAVVDLLDMDERFIDELSALAPFGLGNEEPVLVAQAVELEAPARVVGKDHLKFRARRDGRSVECIGYRMGSIRDRVSAGTPVDLAFTPVLNLWGGRRSVQLKLKGVKPS